MVATLLEPLHYEYFLQALIAGTAIGAVAAFISVYLIISGWSLMGDALSHAMTPGIALAYVFSFPYLLGAGAFSLLAVFAMLILRQFTTLKSEAILGLVFTSFFSYGLIIISMYPIQINVNNILLGNILTLSPSEFKQILLLSAISMLVLIIYSKDFMLLFFNESQAHIVGINILLLKTTFFTLLCSVIVIALQGMGALFVISMVITPGAISRLISRKFTNNLIIAIILGSITSFFGVYLSYYINAPSGAVIVLLQVIIFLLVFLLSPTHGLLAKYYRRTV